MIDGLSVYDDAVIKCRNIFLNRRNEYGDHLEKSKRYPLYNKCGLYEKMVRTIEDINIGNPIKCDTLIDLINYALMELSVQSREELE